MMNAVWRNPKIQDKNEFSGNLEKSGWLSAFIQKKRIREYLLWFGVAFGVGEKVL